MSKPEMVKMVLNRNFVLRSTMGHAIAFVKDEPVGVPLALYAEAVAIGAERADGASANVLKDDEQKPPLSPAERAELLKQAVEDLAQTNARDDFTATGTPTVAAVNRVTGEKFDSKEIAEAWKAFQASKAA